MKRSLLVAILLVASSLFVDSSAQQVVKKRIGSYLENGNVVVAEANTTLAVDITVEYEQFVAGPYAKHAQRLLGSSAPLVNKSVRRVVSSNVAVVDGATYLANDDTEYLANESELAFPRVLPDRLSKTNISADDAAERAAEQIYALRTARLELITAELGDGVYGAGLESALREIDRLEKEYLELFFGKRVVTYSTQRYYIPVKPAEFEKVEIVVAEPAVEKGKKANVEQAPQPEPKMLPASYIVARFSDKVGLVAADDLQGDIVLLTINPTDMSYPENDAKGTVQYRYANNAEVTLSLGHVVISERVLPIYEFGRTVTLLNPTR